MNADLLSFELHFLGYQHNGGSGYNRMMSNALISAISHNDIERCKSLINHENVNLKDLNGYIALIEASRRGYILCLGKMSACLIFV